MRLSPAGWRTGGMEAMIAFFRNHQVRLVASMPCYLTAHLSAAADG